MATMDKIEAVVSVINERKRDDENMSKIWEIQQMFAGEVKKAWEKLTSLRKI